MITLRKTFTVGIVAFALILFIQTTQPGSAPDTDQSIFPLWNRYKSHGDTLHLRSLKFLLDNDKHHARDTIAVRMLDDNITAAVSAAGPALQNGDLTFDDFCEYVLPYRLGTEPLEDWRTMARDSFSACIPSTPIGKKDYVTITSIVNDLL